MSVDLITAADIKVENINEDDFAYINAIEDDLSVKIKKDRFNDGAITRIISSGNAKPSKPSGRFRRISISNKDTASIFISESNNIVTEDEQHTISIGSHDVITVEGSSLPVFASSADESDAGHLIVGNTEETTLQSSDAHIISENGEIITVNSSFFDETDLPDQTITEVSFYLI